MSLLRCLAVAAFLYVRLFAAEPTRVLSFEEIDVPAGTRQVTNGYGGLNWTGFWVFNGAAAEEGSAYRRALVNGRNVAVIGDTGRIYSSFHFSIVSAWVTSLSGEPVTVTLTATDGQTVTFVAGPQPARFELNLRNVSSVHFSQRGSLGIDDIEVVEPEQRISRLDLFRVEEVFVPAQAAQSVAIGDVNGDLRGDMAIATTAGTYLRLGREAGGFHTVLESRLAGWFASLGDYTQDGRGDVMIGRDGVAYASFSAFAAYAVSAIPKAYGAGPVAVANFFPNRRYAFGAHHQATDIAAGDFDGDGRVDYALAMISPPGIAIYRNSGSSFSEPVVKAATGLGNYTVNAHDLDGDGDLDFVIASEQSGIEVALNGGGGNFGEWRGIAADIEEPYAVAIADFDGDGVEDLLARDVMSGVKLARGLGRAEFGPAAVVTGRSAERTLAGRRTLAVGDLNGDRKPDVAFVSALDVVVLINMGGPRLGLGRDGELVRLSWRRDFAPGATLEKATSLDAGAEWIEHPFAPLDVNGANFVYDAGTVGARFFRLRISKEAK